MNFHLNGKTALVTAASCGLGYACALELAREGARVLICSRREKEIKSAAERILKETGVKVEALSVDLSSAEDLQRLITATKDKFKSLDILVLSTGHPPTYSFSDATDEHWSEGIDLILKPVITLSRAFLPEMRSRNYGRMIFIGSIFGMEPEKSSVIQSTLRTGLNALSKCIATESAVYGVTSNVICPGYFDTPLVSRLAEKYAIEAGVTVESVLEDWKNFSPTKKFGKPEDLGAFVAFLASARGEFFNGTSIVIDGGALKQY